jgi:hypothetical protein
MTTPTHIRGEYWAIPIPEDAWNFKPENFKTDFVINIGYLLYSAPGKAKRYSGLPGAYADTIKKPIKLPPGSWQILCTSKECTHEQVYEIVEHDDDGFKDYEKDGFHNDLPFPNPVDSLRSLLTSKGLDTDKNYVILKKVT